MRGNKIMTQLAPFFVLATMTLSLWSNQAIAAMFGSEDQALPTFSIPTLANTSKQLTNKAFLGHVSLLNVWASWCGYCMNEHATLMQIKNTSSVPIYGINFRDDPNNAREYLQKNGNPYVVVGIDWNGEVSNALGVTGTPQTYIIDKHGMIRDHYSGSLDESRWAAMSKKIQQYKAER